MQNADYNILINSLSTTCRILQDLLTLIQVDKSLLRSLNIDAFFGIIAQLDNSLDELF